MSDGVDSIAIRDSVRKHSAMFVGETGPRGILALVLDQVARAIDDHEAGECQRVDVAVDGDAITVRDDGPGLPLDSGRLLDLTVGDRLGHASAVRRARDQARGAGPALAPTSADLVARPRRHRSLGRGRRLTCVSTRAG